MSDSDMNRFILDKLEKVDDKMEQVRIDGAKLKQSFENHEGLDHEIHESVKEMARDMSHQLKTMCKSISTYNDLLKDHMRRTEIAETHIRKLQEDTKPVVEAYQSREVIKTYAENKWKTAMKWIGGISALAGLIITMMKLLELF